MMSDKEIASHELNDEVLQLTADIVSAYVSNNVIPAGDVSKVIKTVYGVLMDLQDGHGAIQEDLVPAVPVRKSVGPDYIVCLEDGKKLKMLKRYLRSQYGMTPEEYRAKWNLPPDYPMVAPNYAAERSKLAKQIGLGRARGRRKKR